MEANLNSADIPTFQEIPDGDLRANKIYKDTMDELIRKTKNAISSGKKSIRFLFDNFYDMEWYTKTAVITLGTVTLFPLIMDMIIQKTTKKNYPYRELAVRDFAQNMRDKGYKTG
jgi:hypothetical protein